MPLQPINLLNQAAPDKSIDENSAQLTNMYLVVNQDQGKYQLSAYYTPGLTLWANTGAGPIRAEFNSHGILYVVTGNLFVSVSSNGTVTTLGTLNTSTGYAKIQAINSQILIIDGSNGYYYSIPANTFATITSDTYVSSVVMATAGNNYPAVPTVVFVSATGTMAAGTATVSGGQVTGVTLTNSGTGYTGSAPLVLFAITAGTGAKANTTVSGGIITGATVSVNGNGYLAPSVVVVDTTGSGAILTCTVSAGGVSTINVVNGGTNYTAPVLYFYDLGGNGATATCTATGTAGSATITAITITSSGNGYILPAIKFIDATGTGASASITTTNGIVTGIAITNAGVNYSLSPICVISDSGGGGATATAYLTTSTFPSNSADCLTQDEFGITTGTNSQFWFASNVSDLKTWPATSFASTTGNQNNLVGAVSLQREIWLFGEVATEVWYNAGNAYFTFLRRPDVFVEYGCVAKQSIVQADNSIFLLGKPKEGGAVVIRMNGFTPQIISTDAINYQISTYTTVSDAFAFAYSQEGHTFYVLTFPTANVTWVYDIATQMWHQRQTNGSRWLPNCYSFCYGLQLVGDPTNGNIYKLDMTNYTDNGTAITRTIQTHPYYNSGNQAVCSRLQIDFDQTPGAGLSAVNLYVSKDGGNTFGSAKPAMPVQTPEGQWRVYWTRLGKARTWVFKIQTSMNSKYIVLGALALYTQGNN